MLRLEERQAHSRHVHLLASDQYRRLRIHEYGTGPHLLVRQRLASGNPVQWVSGELAVLLVVKTTRAIQVADG